MKETIRSFFTDGAGRIVDYFCLNICFLLTSLPIITIGCSCSAMYYVIFHIFEEKDAHLTRQYFKAWKDNFRRSTLIWLIALIIFFLCYQYIYLLDYLKLGNVTTIFYGAEILLVYLTIIFLIFFLSLQARFENTLANMVKNAFYLSIQKLYCSALCFMTLIAPGLFAFFFPRLAYVLIGFMILFGFSIQFYIQSKILFPIYEELGQTP